jgi:ABC-type multidrug transport system fused ATPase/permease subunit
VVILDEASSRLDPATEHLLEQAIDTLLQGRTGIIIAHRLSTIQRADTLLVLEGGRMREYGSRAQLAADPDSHFAHLLRTAHEEKIGIHDSNATTAARSGSVKGGLL